MRVVLADDSVLIREGVARMLADAGVEVVAQARDASELLAAMERTSVDIAVVDIRMPPTGTTEGLVAARTIRERWPRTGVLVLSQHVETHYAVELFRHGAERAGYLLKDRLTEFAELVDALERIAAGGSVIDAAVVSRLVGRRREASALDDLTEREREVLALMAEGRSNQAIGARLFLSTKTVEAHISTLFSKLGLTDQPTDNRRVLSVLAYLRR